MCGKVIATSPSSAIVELNVPKNALPSKLEDVPALMSGDPATKVIGWFDVHYPCTGDYKLIIRYHLPSSAYKLTAEDQLLVEIVEQFEIPTGTIYCIYSHTHEFHTASIGKI